MLCVSFVIQLTRLKLFAITGRVLAYDSNRCLLKWKKTPSGTKSYLLITKYLMNVLC